MIRTRPSPLLARAATLAFAALGLLAAPAPAQEPIDGVAAAPEDLPQILASGELRVVVPADVHLAPRERTARVAHERELSLLRRFATHHGLEPVLVPVDGQGDLIPALLGGRGHVLAAALTVTGSRKERIAFTAPVRVLREQLVVRAGDEIRGEADLVGREVALREKSSFWRVVQDARRDHPGIQIRILPEHTSTEAILAGVLNGKYDMAAVDGANFRRFAPQWPELKLVPGPFENAAVAIGVHPGANELRDALDAFVKREQLARPQRPRYRADLPGIRERGVLRVLTRNNAATYFIWRGELMGFEYELLKRFAQDQELRLEMVVPPARDALIPWLLEGRGDVAAASLTITDRRRRQGVEFTSPYGEVHEVLVARGNDWTVRAPADLAGRTVVVRPSSSYWSSLRQLRQTTGIDVRIEAAPEELETEEIIARVASGEYDLTVSDSHILDLALTWREDVRRAFVLRGPVEHGWAVRASDLELLAALDEYIEEERRGLVWNVVHERYFENPRVIRRHVAQRADGVDGARLSPWDDLVREHAAAHDFDWPLVVAVMYRESRFDPEARSWAGAKGLLQIIPATARRFGVEDLDDPEQSIVAGVRYLAWIYDQFEPELSVRNRTWFTLAAYNAGLGHVFDARRVAAREGLDPDTWFDNVEEAMLLLSRRRFYANSTHGYVRGIEPVSYVRDIRDLYDGYVRLLERGEEAQRASAQG